jgi:hypothetical protein
MSEKYRVNMQDVYARRSAHPQKRCCNMSKVSDTIMDVTKVAVTGAVAIGVLGAVGGAFKK